MFLMNLEHWINSYHHYPFLKASTHQSISLCNSFKEGQSNSMQSDTFSVGTLLGRATNMPPSHHLPIIMEEADTKALLAPFNHWVTKSPDAIVSKKTSISAPTQHCSLSKILRSSGLDVPAWEGRMDLNNLISVARKTRMTRRKLLLQLTDEEVSHQTPPRAPPPSLTTSDTPAVQPSTFAMSTTRRVVSPNVVAPTSLGKIIKSIGYGVESMESMEQDRLLSIARNRRHCRRRLLLELASPGVASTTYNPAVMESPGTNKAKSATRTLAVEPSHHNRPAVQAA